MGSLGMECLFISATGALPVAVASQQIQSVPPCVTAKGLAEPTPPRRWQPGPRVTDLPMSAASPPLNLGVNLPMLLLPVQWEEEDVNLDFALR